jgi:starvation-inducible DNA-binding protein
MNQREEEYEEHVPFSKKEEAALNLNRVLSSEFALFVKTLNYHWNVTGGRFGVMHVIFGDGYKEILEIVDQVAERIRMIDQRPINLAIDMKGHSDFVELVDKKSCANTMLENLLKDHEAIQLQIEEMVSNVKVVRNDIGSEDLLISVLQKHEKMSWVLRSHLAHRITYDHQWL